MEDVALRYWTPAFIEAFVDALNGNPGFQEAAGGFTQTIVLRCFDTPDGDDIEVIYTFEDGQVVNVDLWIDEAPCREMRNEPFDQEEALARVTATYTVWTKLDRGEMGVFQALASLDYTIEGRKLKILAHLPVYNGMHAVAAEMEKTY